MTKVSEQSQFPKYFLIGVISFCGLVFLFNPIVLSDFWQVFSRIVDSVAPVLILVFALLVVFNLTVDPRAVAGYFGKKAGASAWFIAVVAGIISTGPIYLWYPLLSELQEKGVRNGLIATFLYNRAIKIPMIPLIVFYFGWVFIVVLFVVMIVVSIIQGILVDKIVKGAR